MTATTSIIIVFAALCLVIAAILAYAACAVVKVIEEIHLDG